MESYILNNDIHLNITENQDAATIFNNGNGYKYEYFDL